MQQLNGLADLRKTHLRRSRDRVGFVLWFSSFFPVTSTVTRSRAVAFSVQEFFDQRRPVMPFVKIHVLEGRYDEARLAEENISFGRGFAQRADNSKT
jgi:hypothetical protein